MGECTWVVCTHHVHIILYKELSISDFCIPGALELTQGMDVEELQLVLFRSCQTTGVYRQRLFCLPILFCFQFVFVGEKMGVMN